MALVKRWRVASIDKHVENNSAFQGKETNKRCKSDFTIKWIWERYKDNIGIFKVS